MVNQIVAAVIGAMVLMASGSPAATEPAVTELPLESGGIQRVLLISFAATAAANSQRHVLLGLGAICRERRLFRAMQWRSEEGRGSVELLCYDFAGRDN